MTVGLPESAGPAIEAGAHAVIDALDYATCLGDTRAHAAVPVLNERPPTDDDSWSEYAVRCALTAMLPHLPALLADPQLQMDCPDCEGRGFTEDAQ